MDDADKRLLAAVQRDAAVSQTELAEHAKALLQPSLAPPREAQRRGLCAALSACSIPSARASMQLATSACAYGITPPPTSKPSAMARRAHERSDALCDDYGRDLTYLIKVVARDLPHFQEIVQSKPCAARPSRIWKARSSLSISILRPLGCSTFRLFKLLRRGRQLWRRTERCLLIELQAPALSFKSAISSSSECAAR